MFFLSLPEPSYARKRWRWARRVAIFRCLERKRGPGRPACAEGTAKTGVSAIRLSDEERTLIAEAADRVGKPVTQRARETLLAAVRVQTATESELSVFSHEPSYEDHSGYAAQSARPRT